MFGKGKSIATKLSTLMLLGTSQFFGRREHYGSMHGESNAFRGKRGAVSAAQSKRNATKRKNIARHKQHMRK